MNNKNLYLWLACLLGVSGLLVLLLVLFKDQLIGIECTFCWLQGAILFFSVYELFTILIVEKFRNSENPQRVVNLYLGLKVFKILLTLAYAGIYVFVEGTEMKRFILLFLLIYFVYLLFDTMYLTKGEKKLKR